MKTILCLLTTLVASSSAVFAEADTSAVDTNAVVAREIRVTAGLMHLQPSRTPFSIHVVSAADLQAQPIRAVTDALAYVPGIDLRQRGPLGVQSDISIRGGTFEQTAVMLDGLRLNDVQTGHNTMSLPILPWDIDRIEVVKGGAARFFGAGALDGAVNIILKRPTSDLAVRASLVGGDAGYSEGRVSLSLGSGAIGNRVSAQVMRHNGWIPSSDVELQSLLYQGTATIGDAVATLTFGANNKAFGANGFYSSRFPEQWEKVTTYLGAAHIDVPLTADLDMQVRASARVNHDVFRLKRNDPDFYQNTHRTDQLQSQVGLRWRHSQALTSMLVEAGSDAIKSSNLGTFDRTRANVMLEHAREFGPFRLSVGGGLLSFSDRAPLLAGGVEASYQLVQAPTETHIVYTSIQRSGRIPTYTDLYYKDPQTTGNALLIPEHAITVELGTRYTTPTLMVQAAAFRRDGRNMIDYAIDPESGAAMAANINAVEILGVDLSGTIRVNAPVMTSLRLGILYQDVQSSAPTRTRYVADNLRFQGIADLRLTFPWGIEGTAVARAVERVTTPTIYVVADVRLRKAIDMLTLIAEVTNIGSVAFVETGFVTIPPRWARFGVEAALFN